MKQVEMRLEFSKSRAEMEEESIAKILAKPPEIYAASAKQGSNPSREGPYSTMC